MVMTTQRESSSGPVPPVVVVGVDGSPNSIKAAQIALREAAWRGAKVRAVIAWQFPAVYGVEGAIYVSDSDMEQGAAATLETALAQACPDAAARGSIERVVQVGSAADLLATESKSADLVVVGARGHGGFIGLVLGSVTTQVVKHSHCPVLVVPHEHD